MQLSSITRRAIPSAHPRYREYYTPIPASRLEELATNLRRKEDGCQHGWPPSASLFSFPPYSQSIRRTSRAGLLTTRIRFLRKIRKNVLDVVSGACLSWPREECAVGSKGSPEDDSPKRIRKRVGRSLGWGREIGILRNKANKCFVCNTYLFSFALRSPCRITHGTPPGIATPIDPPFGNRPSFLTELAP